MLERQRIILDLLSHSPEKMTYKQLINWLFLLREETKINQNVSFYEFTPCKNGPFSFLAKKEITLLSDKSLLSNGKYLSINQDAKRRINLEINKLSHKTRKEIEKLLIRYGSMNQTQLTDELYSRYSWFFTRRQCEKNFMYSKAKDYFFTIGYEGRSIDGILNQFLRNGITQLIDVRKNALSRKYGFSEKTLCRLCKSIGINYIHLPSLGIPSSLRTNISSPGEYKKLFDKYEKDILIDRKEDINQVAKLSLERPTALMCFEKDSNLCHRSRLAIHVANRAELPIKHL